MMVEEGNFEKGQVDKGLSDVPKLLGLEEEKKEEAKIEESKEGEPSRLNLGLSLL